MLSVLTSTVAIEFPLGRIVLTTFLSVNAFVSSASKDWMATYLMRREIKEN